MIKQGITFEQFVEENDKLAYSILAKYNLSSNKDLYYSCLVAAWRGYEAFDPSMNVKLTTFCYTCMHNEVKGYLKSEKRLRQHEKYIIVSNEEGTEINMVLLLPDEASERDIYKMEEHQNAKQKLDIVKDTIDDIIARSKGARLKVLLAWRDIFNYDANKMQLEEETGVTYAYCYQVLQETRHQIKQALRKEGFM